MAERVRFITHKGKKILFIDLRARTADEIRAMLPQIQNAITSEPRHSVLSLSDWTDAQLTREVADEIKKTMVFDRPHVKRTALVGIEKVPKIFLDAFKHFSRREFTIFSSLEEAKDWLVAD
ncbi:MAG TPA: STAS/SEC14 domain-containing protein [Terriglobales bacterium]|nr:STAS/SEC14 domain-containing protein [Terriglobales bacterium]